MRSVGRLAATVAVVVAGVTGVHGVSAQTAAAGPRWAPAAKATIHPGVQITMGGVTCLAGFVLTDGKRVFLSMPAGCASIFPGEEANGCGNTRDAAGVDPPRTEATIQGARYKGWLAYSSWYRMKLSAEDRDNWCNYNNFALVQLDPRDVKRTNPSIPVAGGPVRVSKAQPTAPDQLTVFMPAATAAQALESTGSGWAHTMMVDGHVSAANAGAPVLTQDGGALGMVTVVPPHDTIGDTTVTNLRKEIHALRQLDRFADVHLARGTAEYAGAGLPL